MRQVRDKKQKNKIQNLTKEERGRISDLLGMEEQLRNLASRMRSTSTALKRYELEDLVQEVFLKTLVKLEKFRGDNGCSLSTWTYRVARNHILDLTRATSIRPQPIGDSILSFGTSPFITNRDTFKGYSLRKETKNLLKWLRENPDEIENGWEVLNIMLRSHGNKEYTAVAMTVHTKKPWTINDVRRVLVRIKQTGAFSELCCPI